MTEKTILTFGDAVRKMSDEQLAHTFTGIAEAMLPGFLDEQEKAEFVKHYEAGLLKIMKMPAVIVGGVKK